MLDAAKKPIPFVQFHDFIARKKVQLMKASQRFQHARFLQEGVARPVNELKRLHDKFDLANAAGAKLDVAAEILLSHDIALDASLDVGDLVEQIGRGTARINKRLMLPQEFVSKLAAAADSSGLDQCQPLPGFAKTAVVMLHTFQRAGQRAGRAFGPKAKIDAKKRAFGITRCKRFENSRPRWNRQPGRADHWPFARSREWTSTHPAGRATREFRDAAPISSRRCSTSRGDAEAPPRPEEIFQLHR